MPYYVKRKGWKRVPLNYIDAIEKIIEALRNEGLSQMADEMAEKLSTAVVSTEYLMIARFYLSKIEGNTVSDITQKQIEHTIVEINRILA